MEREGRKMEEERRPHLHTEGMEAFRNGTSKKNGSERKGRMRQKEAQVELGRKIFLKNRN